MRTHTLDKWLDALPYLGACVACFLFLGGTLFGPVGAILGSALGLALGIVEVRRTK